MPNFRKRTKLRPTSVGLDNQAGIYGVHVHIEDVETGRPADLNLDPDQAEWIGKALLEYAEKARQYNRTTRRDKPQKV